VLRTMAFRSSWAKNAVFFWAKVSKRSTICSMRRASSAMAKGPAGVVFVRLPQEAVAEAADDVQGIANAVGHTHGHLRHGALHHQGFHFPVEGQNLVAGRFQMVMIRLHPAVQPLNPVKKQGDGRNGHVNDGIEAAENPLRQRQVGKIPVSDEIMQGMGNHVGDGKNHKRDGQPVEEQPQGIFRVLIHQSPAQAQGKNGQNEDDQRAQVFQNPEGSQGQTDHLFASRLADQSPQAQIKHQEGRH